MQKQQPQTTPADVIEVLNRSYQTTRESPRRETVDAAQKAFNNCIKWLREWKIPFHQNPKGEWLLDEKKVEQ